MTVAEQISDSETLTVQIPLRLRKRGGRKLMIVPEGATAWAPQRARTPRLPGLATHSAGTGPRGGDTRRAAIA